ncbi:hypothetical protein DSM104443_00820 [Usitatibacter rugosus]|uniref:Cation/multidrug efflux pump n=1 Tax=Usitatibacter rugosus TaxID=2732067 RepID=A0A6M4GQZ5_9PROT|nr:cation/multidrug efflux pump [Usitatibacter rugosus]QJR09770.1 hypothetical protein DSM104443_00820 [Usitatibacter rugosus]
MFILSVTIVCALFAALFFAFAMERWRRGRVLAGGAHLLFSMFLAASAAAVGLLGGTLMTYSRLTHEQPAMEVGLKRIGDRHFQAKVTYPSAVVQEFELLGDEWQVDARLLKWTGTATLLGFDTAYRLERLSGRYTDIAREKTAPRTVHALAPPDTVDVWDLARRSKTYVPWVDALYGSSTFVPMADGATYAVSVSPTGLVARPLNQAARESVGGWR